MLTIYTPRTAQMTIHQPTSDGVTHAANALAVATLPAIWTGMLPNVLSLIATIFTIVWMGMQITIQIQKFLDRKQFSRGPQGAQGEPGEQGPAGPPTAQVVVVPVSVKPPEA